MIGMIELAAIVSFVFICTSPMVLDIWSSFVTVKKKGWSSSKLQTLAREVWSSLRPSTGNEKALPRPLRQEENSLQVTLGKRKELLVGRELLYLLTSLHPNLKKTEESSLLVTMDKVLQSSVATSSALPLYFILDEKRAYSNVVRKTRAPSQNSRQAPPTSRERRGLRLPLSRQKETSCLSRQRNKRAFDFLLFRLRSRTKKGLSFPDLTKMKSLVLVLPPSPAFKHEKINPLLHVPKQEDSFLQVTPGKLSSS